MVRCYRCLTKCERSVDKCPNCGCVAFVPLNFRPSWPPQFPAPDEDAPLADARFTCGAFLLGPMPSSNQLGGLAPERQFSRATPLFVSRRRR